MVPAAGKELRCAVGSGAPWCLCGGRHRYLVKSACVRAARSCLGCRSSRIHHRSIGSVCTHSILTRAANPTTSSRGTIQSSLGSAFRSEPAREEDRIFAFPCAGISPHRGEREHSLLRESERRRPHL